MADNAARVSYNLIQETEIMKNSIFLTFTALLAVLLAGCSQSQQVVSSQPECLPQVSLDQTMQTARTVLQKMHFSIEKYDPDARYIRTRPLSGAQFFEVWRQDNASAYTAARSNLQTLRRIVEIQATPYLTRTCLECRVYLQKLSLPEEPVRGTKKLAGTYTDSSTSEQSLQLDRDRLEKMEWLPASRDEALEMEILTRIREKTTL